MPRCHLAEHASVRSGSRLPVPGGLAGVVACLIGLSGQAKALQPESALVPVVEKSTDRSPDTAELPSIYELISTYRTQPFADRCEVLVRRTRLNQPVTERRATALVRCDARATLARLRLDLGDLTIGMDATQMVFVAAKDPKSFVSAARRESVVASLAEWVPPLPLLNIVIACESTFPDRIASLSGLTWTVTRQGESVSFAAESDGHRIELRAAGQPLRLTDSRIRSGTPEDEREISVRYQPMVFTEKELAVDVSGRESKRNVQDLAWTSPEGEAQPRSRIANITGNTTDYKPWSVADAIASRKSSGDGPFVVAMFMFNGPLGIDARVMDDNVVQIMSILRKASTDLRRAAIDDPATPRLMIEPIAIYEVSTFEREAPRKLSESWAAASTGLSDGATLRWSLSPATTIEKYAKGERVAVVLIDSDLNLIGKVDLSGEPADIQARIVQLVRSKP